MGSEERMVCRTEKRTQNTTICHNMTVRGEKGAERVKDEAVAWSLSLLVGVSIDDYTQLGERE